MAAHEKLANIPGKSLTVEVVDVPPGGRVHRHGGPTIDYVMAGVLRMQILKTCPDRYDFGTIGNFFPNTLSHAEWYDGFKRSQDNRGNHLRSGAGRSDFLQ
jgi:hypothetical protein